MRGGDEQQSGMFSYLTLERRVPVDHPVRVIRAMVDRALKRMDGELGKLYSSASRPSIAPERLLRAQLLMVLYSVRSERQLMEQLNYDLLFRWLVGLEMDDAVWDVTVFTKNRGTGARGRKLLRDTHESTSDGNARLYRKSSSAAVVPGYLGHVITENRHGLVVAAMATQAGNAAECEAALQMLAGLKQNAGMTRIHSSTAFFRKL